MASMKAPTQIAMLYMCLSSPLLTSPCPFRNLLIQTFNHKASPLTLSSLVFDPSFRIRACDSSLTFRLITHIIHQIHGSLHYLPSLVLS